MRFMIIRKADEQTEAGVMPGEELITAMARYNEELARAGVLLAGDGLQPSSRGVRVKFTQGEPRVLDGPFSETKELIAGFTMIDVRTREEAIEWARRWPVLDGDGNVELEVRPVYDVKDFGDSEGVRLHLDLRDELARRQS